MARIDDLRRKLAARTGIPGYEKNCEALRAEIARLEGRQVALKSGDGEKT